jgi:hypothetical protein
VAFVVDKVALGRVFSQVLRFPLPVFIPPISPQSPSPIIRGWYNRPVVAAVAKVPLHRLKKKSEFDGEGIYSTIFSNFDIFFNFIRRIF